MKIDSVDFFYLSMPEVLDIGDGSQDALLVRVESGGIVGWGECETSPLISIASAMTPMSHSACKPVLASVLGQRFDEPSDIARIGDLVRANSFDQLQMDHTLSGIDIALWDLMGKKLGEPAWRLAGYKTSHRKQPYGSVLFGHTPAETYAKVSGIRKAGFLATKLGWGPFGHGTVKEDAEQVQAAREALGVDGILLIDAGTVFAEDVGRAAERLPALSTAQVHWFEEPFHNYALDAYGQLAKTTPSVALAGGEGAHNAHQAVQMMRHGGVKFIQVDTGRIGGITAAKQVADQAVALGVTYVNHTFTSGLGLAASVVPFAGIEDQVICEYPVESRSLAQEIAGNPFPLDADGMIRLNDEPGLGVQVDVAALQKYLVPTEIRVRGKLIYQTPVLK
jgi:L-alanine-DL-glutamate epimerase-like enolase superfamily enzyme